jgi:hypothetical protein
LTTKDFHFESAVVVPSETQVTALRLDVLDFQSQSFGEISQDLDA